MSVCAIHPFSQSKSTLESQSQVNNAVCCRRRLAHTGVFTVNLTFTLKIGFVLPRVLARTHFSLSLSVPLLSLSVLLLSPPSLRSSSVSLHLHWLLCHSNPSVSLNCPSGGGRVHFLLWSGLVSAPIHDYGCPNTRFYDLCAATYMHTVDLGPGSVDLD